MDKSRALVVTLGICLAVSALLNFVAFQRMGEPSRPAAVAAPSAREPRGEAVSLPADRADQVLRELAALRREVAEMKGLPPPPEAAAPGAARPVSAPAATGSATFDDPQVAEVLSEQEHFRAFWRDLDRVFNARGKIDETKYFDTVLDVTLDYLGVADPLRVRFSETARVSAADLARVRKEYDDARRALPPRDKDNAATVDAQRREMDARFRDMALAVTDRVKGQLDVKQPRHAEFASRIDRWLREIAPKP